MAIGLSDAAMRDCGDWPKNSTDEPTDSDEYPPNDDGASIKTGEEVEFDPTLKLPALCPLCPLCPLCVRTS
jgi:hypothetical protein